MVRICILVHELNPPAGNDTGSVSARAWDLCRRLLAAGDEVVLVHTDVTAAAKGPELAGAAKALGVRFVALRESAPRFDVPIFPTGPTHATAHRVCSVLVELEPDACLSLDEPALAAVAIASRMTGSAFQATRFVLTVESLPRELARLRQDRFPLCGRDELVHDFLESSALSAADEVLASSPELLLTLQEAALVRKDRARALAWPATDAGFEPWRATLVRGTPPAAVQDAPRISVCVPYYNQPTYFDEALATLANQTVVPHEVIIVDDGSPTEAGVAAFAAAERKYAGRGWRFVRQANRGAAGARNRLAELATGDTLLFCDHDNRFRPEMIEAYARAYVLTGADCVTSAFRAFNAEPQPGDADRGYVFSPLGQCIELGLIENALGDNNFLVRRSTFLELEGFTEERQANEDWQFLLQLLRRGGRVAAIPSVLFEYRRLPESKVRRQGEFASAVHTLAPILAETEPAWRKLWPHLVSAIRNPQVPQLEHEIQAAVLRHQAELAQVQQALAAAKLQHDYELSRAKMQHDADMAGLQQALTAAKLQHDFEMSRAQQEHAADLARVEQAATAARLQHEAAMVRAGDEIARARRDLDRRRWEIVLQKSALEQAKAETRRVESGRQAEAHRGSELEKRLRALQLERDHSVGELQAKIRRMQSTFSWKLTAPARALRRQFIDPTRRTPQGNAAAPAPAAPKIRLALDTPAFWEAAPTAGMIAGWCLFDDGVPPRAMRIDIDGTDLPGSSGRIREDVAKAHGLDASAAACGFEFHYRLPADAEYRVRIEGQTTGEEWHILYEGVLRTTNRPRDVHDYTAWVATFGTVTPDKAEALRKRLASLGPDQRPLVSVLMPVHNTAERWLERAIESVRAQIYENWELCIADDTSTAPHVRPLLERYQASDPRIRVTFRPHNGHISAASNSALELVRGEFVALLDHDDELSPDALAETVLHLAEHPDAALVYSDEDKNDEEGRRRTPYFKPDYLPDLLLGQNCVSHLSVYRTALVRSVGGFRVGYEGSQDWDLALRVVEKIKPGQVRHIPKVLYHWRAISGSTAVSVSAKNYSVDSARRALLDHFSRLGIPAEVRPVPGDHWQVIYPVPEPAPLVSIIIPTRNAASLLRVCVGSIISRSEYQNYEILVVNNGSDDPEALRFLEELRAEQNVRVLDYDEPFNFSAINNFAVRQARGDVLCFLNNDIEVITGRWLDELVSHAMRPDIGAVGGMLYYPNHTIQHAGVVLGLGGIANHAFLNHPHGTDGYMNRARLAQNYSAVTAACLAVRRQVFEQVGGFNEADLAVAFNDIDLCLRIRAAGYRNLWTPFAELYHHESASRGNDNAPDKQARFAREIEYMRKTWGALLERDPAYNPNLSLDLLGWALAWPPRS